MSTTEHQGSNRNVVFEDPYHQDWEPDSKYENYDEYDYGYGGDYSSAADASSIAVMPGWAGAIVVVVIIALIAWWVVSR